MAQSIKCLFHKHEDLSLIPATHRKKLDTLVHSCDPSTGEMETAGPQDSLTTQPSLIGEP